MGTHLLDLEGPYVLGQFMRSFCSDSDRLQSLDRKLVESMQTTGQVDVVFHRTRVHGLR